MCVTNLFSFLSPFSQPGGEPRTAPTSTRSSASDGIKYVFSLHKSIKHGIWEIRWPRIKKSTRQWTGYPQLHQIHALFLQLSMSPPVDCSLTKDEFIIVSNTGLALNYCSQIIFSKFVSFDLQSEFTWSNISSSLCWTKLLSWLISSLGDSMAERRRSIKKIKKKGMSEQKLIHSMIKLPYWITLKASRSSNRSLGERTFAPIQIRFPRVRLTWNTSTHRSTGNAWDTSSSYMLWICLYQYFINTFLHAISANSFSRKRETMRYSWFADTSLWGCPFQIRFIPWQLILRMSLIPSTWFLETNIQMF